jgi:hypothetical protein
VKDGTKLYDRYGNWIQVFSGQRYNYSGACTAIGGIKWCVDKEKWNSMLKLYPLKMPPIL